MFVDYRDLRVHKVNAVPKGCQGLGSGSNGITGSNWPPRAIRWSQGSQGSIGSQGSSGSQGTQGLIGSQGTQGTFGGQGAQGSQGLAGSQGSKGDRGSQGTQGSQGLGSQGPQGRVGSQGSFGTQGSQGRIGPQGPANGPQGSQGVQGPFGAQGAQGSGSQGNFGSQGLKGSQGAQGQIGPQGPASGPQGSQGVQGSIGTQGAQGTQGRTGSQGLQGPQGTQGLLGTQGSQGPQGGVGSQGSQGLIGTQGSQGAQGTITLQNQLVYVDPTFGSNLTGQVENENRPFATLTAAQTAALAQPLGTGWLIIVRPGTYSDINLGANNINWYFQKGTILSPNGGPLFQNSTLTLGQGFSVFGQGTLSLNPTTSSSGSLFADTASAATNISLSFYQILTLTGVLSNSVLMLTNANVILTAQQISLAANAFFFNATNGQVAIKADLITNNGDVFFNNSGAQISVEVGNMTFGDTGFNQQGGTLSFQAQQATFTAPGFIIGAAGQANVTLVNATTITDTLMTLSTSVGANSSALTISNLTRVHQLSIGNQARQQSILIKSRVQRVMD